MKDTYTKKEKALIEAIFSGKNDNLTCRELREMLETEPQFSQGELVGQPISGEWYPYDHSTDRYCQYVVQPLENMSQQIRDLVDWVEDMLAGNTHPYGGGGDDLLAALKQHHGIGGE